jgi:hypothetical protein
MPIPNTLTLTGKIYIKYIDDIASAQAGDLLLLLNDDAVSINFKSYDEIGCNGYIKAKIYDCKVWQNVDIGEFCINKENRLVKKQRAIDSFLLCKEVLEAHKGTVLNRTYRGHFTTDVYEQVPYIRKSNNAKTKAGQKGSNT